LTRVWMGALPLAEAMRSRLVELEAPRPCPGLPDLAGP
jgi:hypothetical protein